MTTGCYITKKNRSIDLDPAKIPTDESELAKRILRIFVGLFEKITIFVKNESVEKIFDVVSKLL